ncbi:MAG: hypothetical protein QM642_05215 [Edaphocola sp.]
MEMLIALGLSPEVLVQLKIGPILFREEAVYLREIHAGDTVSLTCILKKCREDGARWSFVQEVYRGDGVKAATVNVDGAWIDMQRRKLAVPPADFVRKFLQELPRTDDFLLEPVPPPKN